MLQVLAIVHTLAVIVFSIRILLRDDLSTAARLAWFMVMLFVPYVGFVLYLLFGEVSLGRTVKRGVAVHAMADGLGSRKFVRSKYWRAMREAGVKLSVALPMKWIVDTILFSRLDLLNHRKITVIDSWY